MKVDQSEMDKLSLADIISLRNQIATKNPFHSNPQIIQEKISKIQLLDKEIEIRDHRIFKAEYEEVLEMDYENIQNYAKQAVRGIREI